MADIINIDPNHKWAKLNGAIKDYFISWNLRIPAIPPARDDIDYRAKLLSPLLIAFHRETSDHKIEIDPLRTGFAFILMMGVLSIIIANGIFSWNHMISSSSHSDRTKYYAFYVMHMILLYLFLMVFGMLLIEVIRYKPWWLFRPIYKIRIQSATHPVYTRRSLKFPDGFYGSFILSAIFLFFILLSLICIGIAYVGKANSRFALYFKEQEGHGNGVWMTTIFTIVLIVSTICFLITGPFVVARWTP